MRYAGAIGLLFSFARGSGRNYKPDIMGRLLGSPLEAMAVS
jgi:hypothetical protein